MSRLLEQALQESGFDVSVAPNGSEGLKRARGHDLLIVDVMMPEMNGFEMVRQLRGSAEMIPVLFLTARGGLDDQVKGLDLGGDDYLVKPFVLEELLARLRALLRRSRANQDVLEYDDLLMDTRLRSVKRNDRWIDLSRTEFALLETFMLNPGIVLSKPRLFELVWHEDNPRDPNLIEVYMNYLRTKLEAMGRPRLIHTVRGKGYVLEVRHGQPQS